MSNRKIDFLADLKNLGYNIAKEDEPKFLAAADGLTDDALNKFITTFAKNLPSGGIKSREYDPIRNDLIASEPQFDAITNEKLGQLYDLAVGTLKQ